MICYEGSGVRLCRVWCGVLPVSRYNLLLPSCVRAVNDTLDRQGTESVKEFLVSKLKETEAALKRSLDEKGLTLRQSASDQEVISFLDSRTQVCIYCSITRLYLSFRLSQETPQMGFHVWEEIDGRCSVRDRWNVPMREDHAWICLLFAWPRAPHGMKRAVGPSIACLQPFKVACDEQRRLPFTTSPAG